ncbi:hypothetical protein [Cupriavidus sp. TMH.W2]|uniref:hypothetical protein n=1 Tax=Cupriavidus sp. TMH.W2 TaxID=3434465 RepID=UPI003D76EA74
MRKVTVLWLLAGAVGLASNVAEARVDIGVAIGTPWPVVVAPPPVYYEPPPPVYYEPAPVIVEPRPVVVTPGYGYYYNDWQARAWREQQWRERRWRERQWRERHREWYR